MKISLCLAAPALTWAVMPKVMGWEETVIYGPAPRCSAFPIHCLVESFPTVFSIYLCPGAQSSGGGWYLGRTVSKKGTSALVNNEVNVAAGEAEDLHPQACVLGQHLKRLWKPARTMFDLSPCLP